MQTLKVNAVLQGGKYIIKSVIGQGGFGITYLAQYKTKVSGKIGSGYVSAPVCIKEFFMKELCNRNENTSHVSAGTEGSHKMVTRFQEKFIKEARNIAKLKHHNIVSVLDVFEENGTAYYVMEYCEGGSLSALLKEKYPQGMPESLALQYIRQIAEALKYIHNRNINHLDIKPSNIMLNDVGEAVLIDFGQAKQYDAESGNQTSSTPVGISEGYAPMEQYRKAGVGQFSPVTDIYSLGATFYKLITGQTPPDASMLHEEGLPPFQASDSVKSAIISAMQPRRSDRPQSIDAWLEILKNDNNSNIEENNITIVVEESFYKNISSSYNQAILPISPKYLCHLIAKPIISLYRDFMVNAAKISKALIGCELFKHTSAQISKRTRFKAPITIASALAAVIIFLLLALFSGNDSSNKENDSAISQNTHSIPEGYEVSFTCNVSEAILYIDDIANGSVISTHFLKSGNHTIKAVAKGYQDYTEEIIVDNQHISYEIFMSEVSEHDALTTTEKTDKQATGILNGHEWVDLGLSVKWATCNVGASNPGDFGDSFAWGETQSKSTFEWNNCFDYRISSNTWKIYNIDSQTKITPNSGHDCARENWGETWRMPTIEEFDELKTKCVWTWDKQNNHIGYKVMGKNGNSIFFPAAGYYDGKARKNRTSHGYYWSSTLSNSKSYCAKILYFYNGHFHTNTNSSRYLGFSIRPVVE